jgi:ankyrin repeat protein
MDAKTKRIIFGAGVFVIIFGFILVFGSLINSNQSASKQATNSHYESRSTPSSSFNAPNNAQPPVGTRNQAAIDKQLFNLLSDIVATDDGELEKVENISAARNLIENLKANVDARDESGETPLLVAARNGHIRIMEILLDNKADANAQANNGRTALMWAAHMDDLNMTKLLLKYRANPLLVDSNGFTARTGATQIDENSSSGDKARDRRHSEIMKLLRQAEKNSQSH